MPVHTLRRKLPTSSPLLNTVASEHTLSLLTALALLCASTALALVIPWKLGDLFATMKSSATSGRVNPSPLLYVVAALLICQAILAYASGLYLSLTAERVQSTVRALLFNKIQRLPLPWFDTRTHGANLSLMTNDASVIGNFISGTLISTVPQLLTLAGAVALIAVIDSGLVLWVLGPVAVCLMLIKVLGRKVRSLSVDLFASFEKMVGCYEENIRRISLVKATSLESVSDQQFAVRNQEYINTSRLFNTHLQAISPLVQLFGGLFVLTAFAVLSSRIITQDLPIADVVRICLYGFLVVRPLSRLAGVYGQLQNARAANDRITTIMNQPEEPYGQGSGEALFEAAPSVEFKSVGFIYDGRETLFDSLSFRIAAGSICAIVGENGSGKSTIAKLLMRFERPTAGRLLVNGITVDEYDLQDYRRSIGYVSQTPHFFNTSIRSNLSIGHPSITDDMLWDALSLVGMVEFVRGLNDGLDELIGESGILLSGGQRQRLGLARALLGDPKLLILDEATSMFDPEAEQTCINTLKQRLTSTTILLITHRPASLALANHIYKLESSHLKKVAEQPFG